MYLKCKTDKQINDNNYLEQTEDSLFNAFENKVIAKQVHDALEKHKENLAARDNPVQVSEDILIVQNHSTILYTLVLLLD